MIKSTVRMTQTLSGGTHKVLRLAPPYRAKGDSFILVSETETKADGNKKGRITTFSLDEDACEKLAEALMYRAAVMRTEKRGI